MGDNDNKGKTIFETLGGYIAGITALIVAVTGLVAVLNDSSCSKSGAKAVNAASVSDSSMNEGPSQLGQVDLQYRDYVRRKVSSFTLNAQQNPFNLYFRSELLDTSFVFSYSKNISLVELKIALVNHFDYNRLAKDKMKLDGFDVDFDWTLSINNVPVLNNKEFLKKIKPNDVISLNYQAIHNTTTDEIEIIE